MILFKLDDGRSLKVDAYQYTRTYIGLMEGLPNARMNRDILDRALKEARSLWGERKVHLLPPEYDRTEAESPELPGNQYIVWLTCMDPINPKYQSSELVVVFYSNHPAETPITQILHDHLHQLKWVYLARDFDW